LGEWGGGGGPSPAPGVLTAVKKTPTQLRGGGGVSLTLVASRLYLCVIRFFILCLRVWCLYNRYFFSLFYSACL